MSTKKQLREQAAEREAQLKAQQRFSDMKIVYLTGVFLLLCAGGIALWSSNYLLKNSRNSKNVITNLESYTPWPKEVRAEFQKMLIQDGGRVKPVNTFARFSLLQVSNGRTASFETLDGKKHKVNPDEWLLDALFRGDIAKEIPIFNVDDTDIVAGLGLLPKKNEKVLRKRDRYSYNHLLSIRKKISETVFGTEGVVGLAEKQKQSEDNKDDTSLVLTRQETQLVRLGRNLSLFEFLLGQFGAIRQGENMVNKDILPESLAKIAKKLDMTEFLDLMPEMTPQQLIEFLSQPSETDEARLVAAPFQLYFFFANSGNNLMIIPPKDRLADEWTGIGEPMIAAMQDKGMREWTKNHLKSISDLHNGQKSMFTGLAGLPEKADEAAVSGIVNPMTEKMKAFVDRQKAEAQARYQARIDDIDKQILASNEDLEKKRLEHKKKTLKNEAYKTDLEVKHYNSKHFSKSLVYFVIALLIVAVSWLTPGTNFSKKVAMIAVAVTILALGYDILGIVQRSVIRARPPITNLYDTIIFITAIFVILALALELFTRRGVGLMVAIVAGIAGMFISGRYEVKEGTGDTMDPLIAVLDTNFWLATHVTTINIGYAAGLLAMFLGIYYLLHRFLRPVPKVINSITGKSIIEDSVIFSEDKPTRDFFKVVSKMIYGIVCFCLFFSIVGTILGGVWANYSWGRFWGWDPKENGALMICLWALAILHAKMGGYIRDIGIAVNAVILGMIVTFSWWGVNNLGIGLHSYGFTQGVWVALYITWTVCGLIMACGIPLWLHERATAHAKKLKKTSAGSDLSEEGVPAV